MVSPGVRVEIRRPPVDWPHILDRKSTVVRLWLETDGGSRQLGGPAPALPVSVAAQGEVVLTDGRDGGAVVIAAGSVRFLEDVQAGCGNSAQLFGDPPVVGCAECLRRGTDHYGECQEAEHTLIDPYTGASQRWTVALPAEAELCSGLNRPYAVSSTGNPVILMNCPRRVRPDGGRVRPAAMCFAAEVVDGGTRELWKWSGDCVAQAYYQENALSDWERDLVSKAPGLGLRTRVLPKLYSY